MCAKYHIFIKSFNHLNFENLEVGHMTSKNNRAPLLYYIKLCASFRHHISIETWESQSGNTQFGSKLAIFCPVWPKNLTDDLEQGKSEGFDSCDRPSILTQTGFKSSIFHPVWPWNLMDDLKNHRAPLLYYIKLCASFQIHQRIQTGVTVRVKMDDFLSRVTLKFDRWPWTRQIWGIW